MFFHLSIAHLKKMDEGKCVISQCQLKRTAQLLREQEPKTMLGVHGQVKSLPTWKKIAHAK